jgi:Arc/MetJ-type ribon-helix-helix transcriptional regulator
MDGKTKYATVSIPKAVADRIDYYIENLGFWPSRSSFVREAVLEKFDKESQKIISLRTVAELDTRTETEKKDKDAPRVSVKPE